MTFRLDAIAAGYGRVQVLWEVSVSVAPGEVVALIGANGAGKSTLLRAATGMIPTTGGRVSLDDRDLTGARMETIARAGVAHVPEGRRLFAGLTVRENLRLGGWHRRATGPSLMVADLPAKKGASQEDLRLASTLTLFPALAQRLDQPAGSLSGGEQQMCAIGRAMMSRPRYLLIDELSLGLAPVLVDEILAKLPEITAGGTGVLLVEQDAGAALDVAARGYVLENGRLVLDGPAAQLAGDDRVRAAYLGT
jgi:branched-chain amino acid transport system ATP-binding protein